MTDQEKSIGDTPCVYMQVNNNGISCQKDVYLFYQLINHQFNLISGF